MTKHFCDFCNKEKPQDALKLLVVCDNLRAEGGKEYYDICKDCVEKIHAMIEDEGTGRFKKS